MQVICLYKGLCKNPKIFNTLSGLPYGQEKSGNQEKSGKTKKNDKSQEKSGNFFFKNFRFCQFKFTKLCIFKSLRMIKN